MQDNCILRRIISTHVIYS